MLMHGLRENQGGRFYWLTQPAKPKTDYHTFYEESPVMDYLSPIVRSQIKCCAHEKSCDSFIFEVNRIVGFYEFLNGITFNHNNHLFFRVLKSFLSLVLVWRLHEASSIIIISFCVILSKCLKCLSNV